MIYNNMTFDGYHCLDHMGLIYVPDKPTKMIAPQTVYSYSVGGVPGTVAYGDRQTMDTYTLAGTFYPACDVRDEAEARQLWRAAAQWLGVGRRKLVFDIEPDKYIIAEAREMDNDEYGWLDGGLHVVWLCQPCRWALHPEVLALDMTDQVQADWHVETSLPAPVDAGLVNTGAAAITAAELVVGAHRVTLSGMEILPGEQLCVHMMPPIGAEIIAADGTRRSAMEHMTAFEQLLTAGRDQVSCTLVYAAASGTARLTFTGHGCWR